MKVSHRMMITISGLIWVAVGILLTQIGVGLMTELLKPTVETKIAFFDKFSAMLGTDQAVLCLVVIALVIGFLKGKFVLEKSAQKGVHRIHQMPNPAPLKDIYNARYYILLALMMGLGMSIKYLGLANYGIKKQTGTLRSHLLSTYSEI